MPPCVVPVAVKCATGLDHLNFQECQSGSCLAAANQEGYQVDQVLVTPLPLSFCNLKEHLAKDLQSNEGTICSLGTVEGLTAFTVSAIVVSR